MGSAHTLQYDLSVCEFTLPDPGNAKALTSTNTGTIPIVTAAAETRTLADPAKTGLRLTLAMKTDGGDCVITVASAFNSSGNTIITMNDAGDSIELRSIPVGSGYKWKIVNNDGCSLS